MEIFSILSDSKADYEASYVPDVIYAHRETGELTLQLLCPASPNIPRKQTHKLYAQIEKQRKADPNYVPPAPDTRVFPLIVSVPGSGWSGGDGHNNVTHMVDLCRQGFVVASISYRGTFKDDVRYPAAVQDTREAIRFLRANADKYHIDVNNVVLVGDSSGGHTVAAAALVNDDEQRFNIGEHLEQSAAVKACVIYYGPIDMTNLVADRLAEGKKLRPGEGDYPFEAREMFQDDFLADPENILAGASPINYIATCKKLPRFLYLQGEEDHIIPMAQGLRFCEQVRAHGGRAEFVKIVGAGHGSGCWTQEAVELIAQFLKFSVNPA